jgi:hypothetical protein
LPARRRTSLVVVVLAFGTAIAGCSSASSGGAAPAPTGSAALDRTQVATVLSDVLTGLQSVSSIGAKSDVETAGTALASASGHLKTAGDTLQAGVPGVPLQLSDLVSTGLLRVAGLLGQSATCLTAQSPAKHPDPSSCLPPLRAAEAKDASLARGLITLSAYGTVPTKTFEADLVAALGG